ncbi:5-deoxy-glucuronate isomerase iolb [Lucifera butyrica]|uniref:5-deoxy-glucuronate isomerase iolb n=1 Tax=Lucifera butyrica TaxID=1351585 RepID=A0A498R3K8_9FIRM|nr:5-deoxy-glucuronate isomerase [Lucifera butyrica]VBB05390.1 5-deoxy-glucuronate isomerase iolb [Lucifera butyrica]
MSYLYPFQAQKGYRDVIKAGGQTQHTGLALLTLDARENYAGETTGEEAVLVILSGKCRVQVNDVVFPNLGCRNDVFSGPAASVYIPIGSRYQVTEIQGQRLEVAVALAPATKKFTPFVVKPEDVVVNQRGILNYQREVHDIIVENGEEMVDRIVVGETFTFPGNWSSFPSHKHDVFDLPHETALEEIYHFKVKPVEGFGVQIMYTDDLSMREAYMLKDGDSVALPKGYHPVAAAPGFQVYYLWIMAGTHGRKLIPHDDPKLAWMQNLGPMLKGR